MQTLILPQDPKEARELLEKLLNAPNAEQAWKEAHKTHAGPEYIYSCALCGQRIDDGKPCGCGAR